MPTPQERASVLEWLAQKATNPQPHPVTQLMPSAFELARMAASGATAPGEAYTKGMSPQEMTKRAMDLAQVMPMAGLSNVGGLGTGLTASAKGKADLAALIAKYTEEMGDYASPSTIKSLGEQELANAARQTQGYQGQPTFRAYHGTTKGPVVDWGDLAFVEPGHIPWPSRRPQFQEPGPHRTERGVFFTDDPLVASKYAGHIEKPQSSHPHDVAFWSEQGVVPGSKVFPVDLDLSNSVTVDLTKIGAKGKNTWYDPRIVETAINAAREKGKDFVIIKGMDDVGGAADQIIAVRPAGKVKSATTGEILYQGGVPVGERKE